MSQLSTLNGHGNVFVLISDLLPSAAILRPTETIQRDILVGAITELLWKVTMFTFLRSVIFCHQMCFSKHRNVLQCGEKERAVLAVPDAAVCFEPPSKFSIDGVTEKVEEIWDNFLQKALPYFDRLYFQLHFVTCNKEEELKVQVKKFMGQVTMIQTFVNHRLNIFQLLYQRHSLKIFLESDFAADQRKRGRSGLPSL